MADVTTIRAPFTVEPAAGPLVTTAVHTGHDLRPATARLIALDAATRLREEDPYTDKLFGDRGTRVAVRRSRFEVDLNRPRDGAVYRTPEDSWGLRVWREPLPEDEVAESLRIHDDFYATMRALLDPLAATGPFLVLDLHSYNHRRDGASSAIADPAENPEVNVGTGALDHRHWAQTVDRFMTALAGRTVAGHRLDVRENVRFQGGHLSRWVAAQYPDTGCVLAIEFKKVFMDEWSAGYDPEHLAQLRGALSTATDATLDAVAKAA